LFVGTHVGAIAIPVSKSVAKVMAVEANPDTFQLLEYNKRLNNCNNLELYELAAGEVNGEIEFLLNTANSGGSKRMPLVRKIKYFHDKPEVVKVKLKVLDEVLHESVDLILMDIEGSEYFALKGMAKLLSSARHLIIEFIPDHLLNVSSVKPNEFLALIEPYFNYLYVPSLDTRVTKEGFSKQLNEMYAANISDNGIIFSK
jgi:FkbM family methyltransferase